MLTPNPLNQTLWLDGSDNDSKRRELKAMFNHTWQLYESLFSLISNEQAYFSRPEPLRHPLIFYFGHTATFYVNKFRLAKLITTGINPDFESMFAIGVDEMSWDDLDQRHYQWPSLQQVRDYRARVCSLVNDIIDSLELTLPITAQDPAWVILMGIEHERIHLETSSVIIRQLPLVDIHPNSQWPGCPEQGPAPENSLIAHPGGKLTQGKSEQDKTYGWDNEYGHAQQEVTPFKASRYLVSNGEYLEFVRDGGYRQPHYWSEEGQRWLAYTKAQMPRFWRDTANGLQQRNLTEEIPLPLNWPVEVNQLEAAAFCCWKAQQSGTHISLPTEAQWQLLRQQLACDPAQWPETKANIALGHYATSCPVNRFAQGDFFDISGNVWQWTRSSIDGFSGFAVHPLYDDFSTPTFDGQHNLIKGGSWISTGNEAIRASRYAFRRHFYQHAGFRYVENSVAIEPTPQVTPYETDTLVAQYLEFHYGDRYFDTDNFCTAAVQAVLTELPDHFAHRALDIGCSVGRASFELAKRFAHVDGIDFSARFISQACALAGQGEKRYAIATEGELQQFKSIDLARLGYRQLSHKVHFSQGDANNLKARFSNYQLIYAANLIDRLSQPKAFLQQIGSRLVPGGYLVISSPYTWLEVYTPKDQWLGGIKRNGENLTTLEGLTETLIGEFELVAVKEIPFVIRETKRKFQHSISEMSIWRKRQAD
ncbi:SAM-dependent methyltransferase [Shewanella sp. NFH-SH190041]|uniref:5-histidylcysteine sulfoxide synthase n=1 Tax=Shewanella sp. NFH-SH190041 TaxID=2950245 RepID=UPI0021C3C7AA|nr:5-histidylcysteine sulfoxide synthase [Shewanella sp. NFH-SH190041]BDM65939.1 SAM-dependent methyltransferase [Shewanella sp. NFH-SH190041]